MQVCRHRTDFDISILSPTILLTSCVSVHGPQWVPLGLPYTRPVSCEERQLHFISILGAFRFVFLLNYAGQTQHAWKRSGECRLLVLLLVPLTEMLSVGFHGCSLLGSSSIPNLLSVFIMKGCWILSNASSVSSEMTVTAWFCPLLC